MAIGYVLYNKKAGNTNSSESVQPLKEIIQDELKMVDVCEITDYREFLSKLEKDDYIVIAGGDGTINRYVNNTDGIEYNNEVYYYPDGTGNDFAHDLGYEKGAKPFCITKYLKNLPVVTVCGKQYRYINGIGYGIDGYCCEVADEMKKVSAKKINYTAIAIKGLLFYYKPTNAKITVDGKTYTYKNVWLAPTMNGRFYGGGMMPTPEQKRNSGVISTMIFRCSSKIRTLTIFPSLFKGEHVKHTKYVDVFEGKEITVEFDRPVALQIDGETILGVTSYTTSVTTETPAKEEFVASEVI